jgi:uncharacterized protein (TIRG00374 family)
MSNFLGTDMEHKNNAKWIWITVGILLLAAILFVAFIDMDALARIFQRVEWQYFLLGVALLVIGIVLISVRWRFLLQNKPSFTPTFHANSVSYLLKLLLPVPQALIRLTAFSMASSTSVYQSAPMMLIERFLEIIMRLVALSLAIVLIFELPIWIAVLAIAAILLLGIPAFVLWFTQNTSSSVTRIAARSAQLPDLSKEKLQEAMLDFQSDISTLRAARGITVAIVYSLIMWGLFLLFYAFGFQALGFRIDTIKILAMSAMVLAVLPPSTPAMIGIYQGITVAILLPFGILDTNQATAYALLMFGGQLAVWVILGVWGLRKTEIKISKLSSGTFEENSE